jgi:hypothetical protein
LLVLMALANGKGPNEQRAPQTPGPPATRSYEISHRPPATRCHPPFGIWRCAVLSAECWPLACAMTCLRSGIWYLVPTRQLPRFPTTRRSGPPPAFSLFGTRHTVRYLEHRFTPALTRSFVTDFSCGPVASPPCGDFRALQQERIVIKCHESIQKFACR